MLLIDSGTWKGIQPASRSTSPTTHDLAETAAVSDALVVLLAGRVVEHGPTAAVDSPHHPYTRALAAAARDPLAVEGAGPLRS